jgi:hypothetical protein
VLINTCDPILGGFQSLLYSPKPTSGGYVIVIQYDTAIPSFIKQGNGDRASTMAIVWEQSPKMKRNCPTALMVICKMNSSLRPERLHMMASNVAVFDPGTAVSGSLSLTFRSGYSRVTTIPVRQWVQSSLATVPEEPSSSSTLLPKHRTWSGSLLFTLPRESTGVPGRDQKDTSA